MGLLDDAIREHLDLKRRHGANPAEVARQEQEALGPVRREATPPPQGADEEDDDGSYEPTSAEEAHQDELYGEEPVYDEDLVEEHDEPDDDEDDDVLDQPTEAHDAGEYRRAGRAEGREVVPADEEPGGDDVLEETPEFLQETPEHDRLWFEQKPPKDFDF
jgi:hypothetical protein